MNQLPKKAVLTEHGVGHHPKNRRTIPKWFVFFILCYWSNSRRVRQFAYDKIANCNNGIVNIDFLL